MRKFEFLITDKLRPIILTADKSRVAKIMPQIHRPIRSYVYAADELTA